MQIIQTTTSLSPEFGGPARCVPALSYELAKFDNQVTILSFDFALTADKSDLLHHPNLRYLTLKPFLHLGMRPIWIQRYGQTLQRLVSNPDDLLIHENGIWLPYSGITHRIAGKYNLPVITSIHGMLEPWALSFGRARKKIAWQLFQQNRLAKSAVIHATSKQEAQNLRKLGLTNPIALIPNGTELPDLSSVQAADVGQKKVILFISRIHPKKGLLNLIGAIDQLRPQGWLVVLAGYDESGYLKIIQAAIKNAGIEDYFLYLGPVSDREKWSWYKLADLFILPSYSENFGIVVAEALASGTPVITSQGTPWKDLLDYNCGWWVEPNQSALTQALQEALSLSTYERKQMGRNGRNLVEQKYSWPAIASRMQQVYRWILEDGSQPQDIII